ncbi:hypothetical protein FNYG_08838 [Fusarium nygamai]|uniref:Uncharacterized protein n=1 Tax=Gibberella nygamai TaxID=42673 RepID=A0A2K0W654_GIBNY|nr:hypothetical protein FNYG_08838 [Fusarium nygamai]
MAAIGKSLVLSIDMPLLIPYPGSTAMASYVTSTGNMSIFNGMDDARVLARDSANFMKSQGWKASAGLASSQPWKPVVIHQGRKWPQVIAADDVRQLGWDAYDQIGQPPQDDEKQLAT